MNMTKKTLLAMENSIHKRKAFLFMSCDEISKSCRFVKSINIRDQ